MTTEERDEIERLVCEAYEIGYAHGGNAFRMSMGKEPLRVDDGWGTVAKKLKDLFRAAEAMK